MQIKHGGGKRGRGTGRWTQCTRVFLPIPLGLLVWAQGAPQPLPGAYTIPRRRAGTVEPLHPSVSTPLDVLRSPKHWSAGVPWQGEEPLWDHSAREEQVESMRCTGNRTLDLFLCFPWLRWEQAEASLPEEGGKDRKRPVDTDSKAWAGWHGQQNRQEDRSRVYQAQQPRSCVMGQVPLLPYPDTHPQLWLCS